MLRSYRVDQQSIRRCVQEAAESYADDHDFELSKRVTDIIQHFDDSPSFLSPAYAPAFVSELAGRFPECEWSLFSTTLALYMQDIFACLKCGDTRSTMHCH